MLNNALASIKIYAEGSETVAKLLGAVSAISLIVGGIGIMNIMLANVTERTREIGIRAAIGTRRRDILRQFLAEAILLSLVGGALGVAMGFLAASFVTRINGWATHVPFHSILEALACSIIAGTIFGYYPARHAASLPIVESLRAE